MLIKAHVTAWGFELTWLPFPEAHGWPSLSLIFSLTVLFPLGIGARHLHPSDPHLNTGMKLPAQRPRAWLRPEIVLTEAIQHEKTQSR